MPFRPHRFATSPRSCAPVPFARHRRLSSWPPRPSASSSRCWRMRSAQWFWDGGRGAGEALVRWLIAWRCQSRGFPAGRRRTFESWVRAHGPAPAQSTLLPTDAWVQAKYAPQLRPLRQALR